MPLPPEGTDLRRLVTIDPAARRSASAAFEHTRLHRVQYLQGSHVPPMWFGAGMVLLVEKPRNYKGFGIAHDDLDRLRANIKAFKAHAKQYAIGVFEVYPSEWKGNVPKEVHHRRCWGVLDDLERSLLPCEVGDTIYHAHGHNIYDAVAMGLTALGRVGRGGVSIG